MYFTLFIPACIKTCPIYLTEVASHLPIEALCLVYLKIVKRLLRILILNVLKLFFICIYNIPLCKILISLFWIHMNLRALYWECYVTNLNEIGPVVLEKKVYKAFFKTFISNWKWLGPSFQQIEPLYLGNTATGLFPFIQVVLKRRQIKLDKKFYFFALYPL